MVFTMKYTVPAVTIVEKKSTFHPSAAPRMPAYAPVAPTG